jgi:hypothetical protein
MPDTNEQFADAELSRLLASIDHRVPVVNVNYVISRAHRRSGRPHLLIAAAALLAVAGVAAASVPGTFLNRYAQRLLTRVTQAPATVAPAPAASDAASRGISFAPGAQVDVDFRASQASGALQVRWAEVGTVLLAQTGSEGEAHYALTPTGVVVDNEGSTASYSLVLPRTLPRARVRISGRVVLSKDGDTVSCAGARDDSGTCVIVIGTTESPRPPLARGTPKK